MQRLIEKIEAAGFHCEAGPLALNQDWLLLKAELGLEGLLQKQTAEPQGDWRNFDRTLPKRNDAALEPLTKQEPPEDEYYDQAVQAVREVATTSTSGIVSISAIQRRLRLGYNRSSRLVEEMERRGVVTAPDDQGRRKVIGHQPPQPCSCGDYK